MSSIAICPIGRVPVSSIRASFSVGWLILGLLIAAAAPRASAARASDGPEETRAPGKQPPPTDPPASAVPEGKIWFLEARTGLNEFEHITGARGEYRVPEIFGSGCMLFDYDGDGDLDAYMVQSGDWPDTAGGKIYGDKLYRNDGYGNFADVTQESGLGDTGYGMGVCAGDYDNDGDLDVWTNNFGKCNLYRNEGNGKFSRVTDEVGLGDEYQERWWATSACWLDFDLDGLLDLYVGHYLRYTHETNIDCGTSVTGMRDYCSPKEFAGIPDGVYHNNGPDEEGHWTFTNVLKKSGIFESQSPEVIRNAAKALGVVCADFNGDLWPDIYVANDQVGNFLYLNQKDGTFAEEAFIRGCAFSAEGVAEASMGVTAGDFDNDGDFDLFMGHLDLETNTLYKNDGEGFFDDATRETNMSRPSISIVTFGTEFFDFDNDADLDVMTANGHVLLNVDKSRGGVLHYAQPTKLFVNNGKGVFADESESHGPFFPKRVVGRGLAVGDVDNDGDIDVLINMHGDHEERGLKLYGTLLINAGGNRRNSLSIRLIGDGKTTNRMAVCALVRLTAGDHTQTRMVQAGTSYASQSDVRLFFGLGDAKAADRVEIVWPNKKHSVEIIENIEGNQTVTIEQGKGIIRQVPYRKEG